jgi:phosphomannomutase
VLQYLHAPPGRLAHLHIMPTCGTRYYIWRNGAWRRRYAEDLTENEKRRIISVLAEGAKNLGFWEQKPWGEIIEDRDSQITYSALGQKAPADAKREWDRDGSKKRKLRDYAAKRLPDLEVQVGGTTSVDVTRKGIDKAYGIKRLIERLNISPDQLLFIGDRLREGGNDYPVRVLGVRWLEVTQWQDTARCVQDLVTNALPPLRALFANSSAQYLPVRNMTWTGYPHMAHGRNARAEGDVAVHVEPAATAQRRRPGRKPLLEAG